MSNDPRTRLQSLLKYVQQADEHLSGQRQKPPRVSLLEWDEAVERGTIFSTVSGEDEYGPFIAARVEDTQGIRSPRLFDPAYLAAFGLAELSLLTLKWHHTTQKGSQYFRLMLCGPAQAAGEGITASRVIVGTRPGRETTFLRNHYDLRREALDEEARRRPRPPRFGRTDVLERAQEAFEIGSLTALLGTSAEEFTNHLDKALNVADAVFWTSREGTD